MSEKSVEERLRELEDQKECLYREAKLREKYPDLVVQTARWGKKCFSSVSVNDKVDKIEMRHNCGCCPDSPLEVFPYLEDPLGFKVYSNPSCFQVGELHYIAGDKPYDKWEEELRKVDIPQSIIDQIQKKFDDDKKMRIEIAEES